jgi:putative transposase
MTAFIDEHRGRFGVEPICTVLEASPSSYYARKTRPRSRRACEDERLLARILQLYTLNYSVYGPRRVWKQLRREGIEVGRDRVARLMKGAGLVGIQRGKRLRTTIPDLETKRPSDLVERCFVATRPNQLWVADLTYVRSLEVYSYLAFVLDVYSRLIVGWQLAKHLRTELVLDALEMAVWRRELKEGGLIHHSDRGSQYTSYRFTSRLAELGISPSVGSVADAYDNAMAESFVSSFKGELVERSRFRSRDEAELAAVEWIGWYNHRRLHSSLGDLPPSEYEEINYTEGNKRTKKTKKRFVSAT